MPPGASAQLRRRRGDGRRPAPDRRRDPRARVAHHYPSYETLTGELTKTLGVLRAEHPGEPLLAIPVHQLRGAVHDYLGWREHPGKRGRFKRASATRSITWTRTPKVDVDGNAVRVRDRGLGTLRARLTRPLPPGATIRQVKLVRRQTGVARVCPTKFALHLTFDVPAPAPEHPPRGCRRVLGVDIGGRRTAADDTGRMLVPQRGTRHIAQGAWLAALQARLRPAPEERRQSATPHGA